MSDPDGAKLTVVMVQISSAGHELDSWEVGLSRLKLGKLRKPTLDRGKEATGKANSPTPNSIEAQEGDAGNKAELGKQAVRGEKSMG